MGCFCFGFTFFVSCLILVWAVGFGKLFFLFL